MTIEKVKASLLAVEIMHGNAMDPVQSPRGRATLTLQACQKIAETQVAIVETLEELSDRVAALEAEKGKGV